ncbi:hypothetical protein [Seonamhaeicola sp.]|uniref:hypothetical protein n=1 Tax=Seonamhaeicola sp. TaxID=1912245 RepID=UPI002606E4E4|nr:hypothetical protein [Seonamhaeicola sp.]
MHGSIGHFKALLQRRKARKQKAEGRFDKRKHLSEVTGEPPKFNFPKLSPKELKRLKADIKAKIERNNFNDYLLYIVIFLILFMSFYYFIN